MVNKTLIGAVLILGLSISGIVYTWDFRYDEGHVEGYEIGYDLGSSDGFEEGFIQGQIEGNKTGYISGRSLGEVKGYDVGYEIGFNEGNFTGYEIGHYQGYSVGFNEGHNNGSEEGYDQGLSVGWTTGIDEGREEGYEVGYPVGYEQGIIESGEGHYTRNPSYIEVSKFIAVDKTDREHYYDEEFNCYDFSATVKKNAFELGYQCYIVFIEFGYSDYAHSIIAFNTTNKGWIFIEPQDDMIVNIELGKPYWDRSYYLVDYDDTITSIDIVP